MRTQNHMIQRIPITQARINLGQVVRRAHLNREYFILEKDGIPVAGIMNADELEDYLEMRDPGIRAQIRRSQEDYRRGRARKAGAFLAELRRPVTTKKK
jgi:PHD/YefM family antitoxin component YafN of YafNO toxin-antitoxin module